LNKSGLTKSGGNTDLAFAVVVLASYFAIFTSIPAASNTKIFILILAGIIYLSLGIYGYSYAVRCDGLGIKIAYFLIQIIFGSLIIYLGGKGGFDAMMLLPLAGQSVMLLPSGWSYLTNLVIFGGYSLAIAPLSLSLIEMLSKFPIFLAGQIFIMVFTQMAVSEEKARTEVERLAVELGEANTRLREYALQVEELTITKERNRLAREIHDGLGHFLTTINMQLQAARAILNVKPMLAADTLTKAQTLTQEALTDVRNSVASLRSATDQELPLPDSLKKLLGNFGTSGIQTQLIIIGNPRTLLSQVTLTFYRIIQEALNNIYKHSKATLVQITINYLDTSEVKMTIKDNGIGAASLEGGFGLIGIKERVHLLDGQVSIDTAKGAGFTLEVKLPG
jgi:signal transduction histidine kinase